MRKATMQDIANELNVSRNTISRALRNKSGVSEETKREIKAVAEKLGYTYTKKVDDSVMKDNLQFVLLVSSFALSQTGFFGVILEELKDITSAENHTLEVVEVPREDRNEHSNILKKLKSYNKRISGVFILSHITNDFIKQIIDLNYPTVIIDHHSPKLKADAVVTQNEFGSYDLVDHLINNNISEIGFIGNISLSPSYKERYIGYRQCLQDNGIDYDSSIVISDVQEEQKALFDKISSLKKMPNSWLCVNSGLAFILNTFLHSKGYSVPEDISIVCFDDTEFSRQSSPAITCVGTDLKIMARHSYKSMQYRLANPQDSFTEMRILPEFFDRASVQKNDYK